MKIEIVVDGEKKSFNLVQLINEPTEVEVPGILNTINKKIEMITVAYCYDKAHKPHKFPAHMIERYD